MIQSTKSTCAQGACRYTKCTHIHTQTHFYLHSSHINTLEVEEAESAVRWRLNNFFEFSFPPNKYQCPPPILVTYFCLIRFFDQFVFFIFPPATPSLLHCLYLFHSLSPFLFCHLLQSNSPFFWHCQCPRISFLGTKETERTDRHWLTHFNHNYQYGEFE